MKTWFIILPIILYLLVRGAAMTNAQEGPHISDAALFDALNLDYPGLEKVKAAVQSGDLKAAKHEYAAYLHARQKPVWKFDWRSRPKHDSRPKGANTENADRVMNGEVWSCYVWHKFDGPIQWDLNPFGYKEWPWQLNRHGTWRWLAQAYWDTGEEKYAQEFVRQMQDWVKRYPSPTTTSGNETYVWRTIEQGIRMGQAWPEIFFRFLSSPSFTDEAVVTMVKSFVEHARVLEKNPSTGNWLTMETNGLMHVGVLFPEFKEAESWRRIATDRTYIELDKQVYPDGAQIELSTGYHQASLMNFVMLWDIAHLNNVSLPADFVAKIGKMYDYNLNAAMPNGYLPGLNDAGSTNIRGSLKRGYEFFPDRKDYLWMAADGKDGEKPKVGSIALPFSGHIIMRTGWEPDDLYMLFDAGPFGYGHQHEDALSFVIYAYGKYMLVDAGNYPYDSSEWRKYVLSTRAHNTIMVDGQDQRRRGRHRTEYVISKPLPVKWATTTDFDYAHGFFSDGYGDDKTPITHDRHVFFVKPNYWIVTDFLTPADGKPHKYESMFHLDADVETDGTTAQTVSRDAPNLTILSPSDDGLSVRVVKGQEKPVVQGWMPAGGYDVRPLPTPIFEKEASGPTNLQYVIFPTAKGIQCPITSVKRLNLKSASGIEVAFADGRTDYFVQAEKAGRLIEFQGFRSNAAATYIRIKDGKLVKAMQAGGTFLLHGEERVPVMVGEITDLSKTDVTHKF